jgi:regulation of enolase protein 1 (concanavalin A-like superfamily)
MLRVCRAATRLFPLPLLIIAMLNPSAAEAQALPPGWTGANVGSPSLSGRATYSGATFNVEGTGIRIGYAADQFYYVYKRITGDVTIVARVASIEYTHRSAKAGVMIRESLTGDSRHALALVTPARGIGFHRRTTTGGRTTGTNVSGAAPVWLRLVRSGSTFKASRSNNGTTWTTIASATIPMKSTVYVGLAVSSYNPSQRATGMFTNVSVKGTLLTPPTVTLTAPIGLTYTAPGTVILSAMASDPDGVARVEFYANNALLATDSTSPYWYTWTGVAAGTYSLKAVARDTRGAVATTASRTISVIGAGSNSPPSISLTAPAAGSTYVAPASVAISANAADANGSIARVDFYAGSTLVGSDTTSPHSITWSNAPAGSFSLTAVARDNQGATTRSSARNIAISASTTNTPPTASLTAPAAGSTYLAPASLTIGASAADANGSIARVDFYAGSTLVGSDTTSPYSVTWSNVPAGSFSLTAVARDNQGATTRSAARAITVSTLAIPKRAIFTASPDHSTITRYQLDIFTAGTSPGSARPIAGQNLGKPSVINGDCTVDIAATISALPGGKYYATVVAIGSTGTSTRAVSGVFAR